MLSNRGIYTLANDHLYDQVIALINSVRMNYDRNIPICIIPYDDKVEKLTSLRKENVFLFDNRSSIRKWSEFASAIWNSDRFSSRKRNAWYHGANTIRKLCSFDGKFEEFIYIDSDELVMSSLEDCFQKLNEYDCVFDDWEHRKENCFLDTNAIARKYPYSRDEIKRYCHCSDFFAAKSSLLSPEILDRLKFSLLEEGEVDFIQEKGWWDEVYLFSYLTFKMNWKFFNYTMSENSEDRTGNIAGVNPFVEKNHVLYNEQGLKPIHRIHYMGYSAKEFQRLCRGEEVNIPHRDVFLYYRFLEEPEARPKDLKTVGIWKKSTRLSRKILRKLSEIPAM